MGDSNDDSGGDDSSKNVYNGSMEPVLVLLSDLYSEEDRISL